MLDNDADAEQLATDDECTSSGLLQAPSNPGVDFCAVYSSTGIESNDYLQLFDYINYL